MKRPQATVFGAILICARTASGVISIVVAALAWPEFVDAVVDSQKPGSIDEGTAGLVLIIGLSAYGLALLFALVVAFFVYVGHNWARILAMAFSTVSILVAFLDYWNNGVEITLRTTLLSVTLDILILLALSSASARQYARRLRS